MPTCTKTVITQNTIQQILSRIDIIEIVGSFVKLKKRGANYLGLCPFHYEKTPSFTVSPSKEIYKCFGCGKSGNAIGFLMEHEKYSYVEALRWLAQKYNVEIEETDVGQEAKQQQQLTDSLYIINNFAQKYFSDTLFESEEGQAVALSYFKERGFREETIRKFQLGYCLEERDAFAKTALSRGYKLEYLLKTGLVVLRNEQPADNYRGRVIFPVHNQTGKIIGFGARTLKTADRGPKYINTPENELYVKSKILYGTYFARHAIDKTNECLLVEGYTDVISLHQAGMENVVASGGTSLTADQLRLIKKYTNNLTILYDGDSAGIKAALRGLDLAIEEGLNVKLVLIPDNEDPDSYVRKVGAAAFRDFIAANKKDFILFKLQVALTDAGNDPSKKSELVNQLAETIARIDKVEDFTKQQDYIKQCSELLKIEEQGLIALVNKFIRTRVIKREQLPANEARDFEQNAATDTNIAQDDDASLLLLKDERQERSLVRVLLEYGHKEWEGPIKVAQHIFESSIDFDLLENSLVRQIVEEYKRLFDQGEELSVKQFIYHPDPAISQLVVEILDFPYELSPNWEEKYELKVPSKEELYKEDVSSVINYLTLRKIKRLLDENQKDLEKAATTEERLTCLQLHMHLKKKEQELTRHLGTVIFR